MGVTTKHTKYTKAVSESNLCLAGSFRVFRGSSSWIRFHPWFNSAAPSALSSEPEPVEWHVKLPFEQIRGIRVSPFESKIEIPKSKMLQPKTRNLETLISADWRKSGCIVEPEFPRGRSTGSTCSPQTGRFDGLKVPSNVVGLRP